MKLGLYNTGMTITILAAISGWLAGIIINYLADVLPVRRSICKPFCLQCGTEQVYRNYFIWPRTCFVCGRKRGLRTWLVEIIAAAAALGLWAAPPGEISFAAGLILVVYFGVVVVIDMEHHLILHPVSLVGGVIGLIVGISLHGVQATLLGGAAGFGIMLGLYFLGIMALKIYNRIRFQDDQTGVVEEALGFGDVNLSGVLGLMLGWPGILAGLMLAIMLGGIVSLIYLVISILGRRYQTFAAIPYGPFLVAAAVFLLFFQDVVISIMY